MVYNWKTLLEWMIWGYHYFWKHPYTLPETKIAPKNDGFPIGISFSRDYFQALCHYVSFREGKQNNSPAVSIIGGG